MKGQFEVRYTDAARVDLLRLFDFLLDRASTVEELNDAELATNAIEAAVEGQLSRSPFIYRKVGDNPFRRELVIPFRAAGYVALYEIEAGAVVNVVAVRHQREDDYY